MARIKNIYHSEICEQLFPTDEELDAEYKDYLTKHCDQDGEPIENKRMFGNFIQCMKEGMDFLRSMEEKEEGDLYYIVATPYNDKYGKYKLWYDSQLALRAVVRTIKEKSYLLTREREGAAKTHINCLVRTRRDLVKDLNDKNKYKFHYHVEKVNRPMELISYMFKDSHIYTFINGDDYVVQYEV